LIQIESADIVLKPWILHNAQELAAIANNKNISDNLRDGFPHPYSYDDAVNWLSGIIMINDPPRFFAIYYQNKLAGSIGLITKEDIYRKNSEIGYFLDEKLWGRGIISNAIKLVTSYCFRNFDIIRIYAEPFADNQGSRRALEKAGFKCEAVFRKNVFKNGIVKDSCIYSILKDEFIY
jgi:[ribosomal protein S5]-alanine N-acetyltransferase